MPNDDDEEDELVVSISQISDDVEESNRLNLKDIKDKANIEIIRIRGLTSKKIKDEIAEAGHENIVLNFENPDSIIINDFSNLPQLIPSAPNDDLIKALKERNKWDDEGTYGSNPEEHIAHVNVLAAIAFPAAFFELDEESEEE